MAIPNPLPFQYGARWSMIDLGLPSDADRVLEDRDRQLEDFLGQLYSVLGWENVVRTNAVGATTSAGYVDWPTVAPLTSTFRKARSDTRLIVELGVSFYTSAGGVIQRFGVNIGGVDYTVIDSAENPATTHDGRAGFRSISGLAAGTYTVTLRAMSDGAATLNCDGVDTQSWSIRERFF